MTIVALPVFGDAFWAIRGRVLTSISGVASVRTVWFSLRSHGAVTLDIPFKESALELLTSSAPGEIRTPDPLIRSPVQTVFLLLPHPLGQLKSGG